MANKDFEKQAWDMISNIGCHLEKLDCDEDYTKLYEYLDENVIDINYICNMKKEYVGARASITVGGPWVWIDTEDCALKIVWGTYRDSWGLSASLIWRIDSYFEEWFNN